MRHLAWLLAYTEHSVTAVALNPVPDLLALSGELAEGRQPGQGQKVLVETFLRELGHLTYPFKSL